MFYSALLLPTSGHFPSHFEIQKDLKDVAEAKQRLIMTQQGLRRAVMLNNRENQQQEQQKQHKLQRIPSKCDVKDLDLHHDQDCRWVGHNW